MDIADPTDCFPRFFKIIFEPRQDLYKLGIPIKFMTQYGNDLLDIVTLKIPTGKTWIVRLLKENGRAWLIDGWHEFVNHYSICHGHFLVFTYEGMSQFSVLIFDMPTCEIEYPLEPQETEDSNIMTETHVIKINPSSTCSSSKDMRMPDLVGQYQKKVGSLTRAVTNRAFTIRMQKSHVTDDFRCNVPIQFAAKYLRKNQTTCTLQNATGAKWPVQVETKPAYVRLSTGWKEYTLENKLQVGDICIFKLRSAANQLFNVEIIRGSSTALSVDVAGPSGPIRLPEEVPEVIVIDN